MARRPKDPFVCSISRRTKEKREWFDVSSSVAAAVWPAATSRSTAMRKDGVLRTAA